MVHQKKFGRTEEISTDKAQQRGKDRAKKDLGKKSFK